MRPNWTGRRQAERRTCSIKAQAQPYDGSAPLDCIVTDFSAVGARIEFPGGVEPPTSFDLFMPSRGDTRPAVVRWKTPDAIGIEFLQARSSTEDQRLTDLLVRVSRLEEELRALRADAALARGSATEPASAAPPVLPLDATPAAAPDEALLDRVAILESRSDEMLRAMRHTLTLLGELRSATAPPAAPPLAKAG